MRLAPLALILALVACSDLPRRMDVPDVPPSPDQGKLLAYLKILAADERPVGFVERRRSVDADGVPSDVDLVKSWDDFAVRGYIYGNGRAVKHVIVPPGLRKAEGRAEYEEPLAESDRDEQIAKILDLPRSRAPFTLVPAEEEDIRRTRPPDEPRR